MKLHKEPPPGYFSNQASSTVSSSTPTPTAAYTHTRASSSESSGSASTANTQASSHTSCSLETDDCLTQTDDIPFANEIPTREALESVSDIPVYDGEGNARTFRSLYSGVSAIGVRQLIVFVRHFYCGACQAYLKALTKSIDRQTYFTMEKPTSIIIIGCGSPEVIPLYKSFTGTSFPVFAEPSRKLFKGLGMGKTLDIGKKRPEYMKDISPPAWLAGQVRQVAKVPGTKKFKGGNPFQIGGEFLIEDEEVVYAHIMKDYRDHSEVAVLRKVLDIDT